MSRIEELTEKDIALLRNSKASVIKKLWYAGLVALVMSFIIPLLPWRYGSLVHVFPYPLAVTAQVLTFGFIIAVIYREERKKLEKEIRYGKKIIYDGVVIKKEHSKFTGEKYYLCVSVDEADDKRMRVSQEEYDRIGAGQKLFLEYAQMSMTFLRLYIAR